MYIISMAALTCTGRGDLPQKPRGSQGLKSLLSGPVKESMPSSALEAKKKKKPYRNRQPLA